MCSLPSKLRCVAGFPLQAGTAANVYNAYEQLTSCSSGATCCGTPGFQSSWQQNGTQYTCRWHLFPGNKIPPTNLFFVFNLNVSTGPIPHQLRSFQLCTSCLEESAGSCDSESRSLSLQVSIMQDSGTQTISTGSTTSLPSTSSVMNSQSVAIANVTSVINYPTYSTATLNYAPLQTARDCFPSAAFATTPGKPTFSSLNWRSGLHESFKSQR